MNSHNNALMNSSALAPLKLPEIFGLGACLLMFLAFYKVEYFMGYWSVHARPTLQNELFLGSVFFGLLAYACYLRRMGRRA